jgi:DNA polymerase-3 subunit delta
VANIYYLIGPNQYKIKCFLDKYKSLGVSFSFWDMQDEAETNINFFEDLCSSSLFEDTKYIVVYNADLIDKYYHDNLPILTNWLSQPEPNIELILISNNPLSFVVNQQDVIAMDNYKDDEIPIIVNQIVSSRGFSIDSNALSTLIKRTNSNLFEINNYLDIICNYVDDKTINNYTVERLVPREVEEKVYILTDAIIKKNKEAYNIYQDLYITFNKDTSRLIISIARACLNYIMIDRYVKKGLSDDEIAQKLNFKGSARVRIMRREIKPSTQEQCQALYKKLSNLDYNIKSSGEYREVGLDLIILEYIK